MSYFVINLCGQPPDAADEAGAVRSIEDTWPASLTDGLLTWNEDDDPSGATAHQWVRNPAAALETAEPEVVGDLLLPFFRKFIRAFPCDRPRNLLLLCPAGVSPRGAAALRGAIGKAGWKGGAVISDGAFWFALARAWTDKRNDAAYVVACKRRLSEASLVQVATHKQRILVSVVRQCRDENLDTAARRAQGETEACFVDPSEPIGGRHALVTIAQAFHHISKGSVVVDVERNGVIGIRAGMWDLIPLIDEDAAMSGGFEHRFDLRPEHVLSLDLWFGYSGHAVHPLNRVRLMRNRVGPLPGEVTCVAQRRLDGAVVVSASNGPCNVSTEVRFPILVA